MVSSPRPLIQPPPVSGQMLVPLRLASPAVPYAPAMAISHAICRKVSEESEPGPGAQCG